MVGWWLVRGIGGVGGVRGVRGVRGAIMVQDYDHLHNPHP